MKTKKPFSMVNNVCMSSKALFHSKLIENGKELVVACGYEKGGEFGYFICYEQSNDKGQLVYTDEITFKRKANERTFQEVIAQAKEYVEAHKIK